MFSNADMTFYSCGNDGKFTRYVIKKVFWDDVKQSNIIRSGMSTVDSVKIFVPAKAIPNGLKFNSGKDIIAKGEVSFEVDNTSPQTISASTKVLQATYRTVTLSVVDDKTYGSPSMQHWELSCK